MTYHFGQMTLEELIRPEGFPCACGKTHSAPVRYISIRRNAVEDLPKALCAIGCRKPFVVCDKNTRAAAAERAVQTLRAAGIACTLYEIPSAGEERIKPGEWELGSMAMHFDPTCDVVLAVGGGVINDLCKMLAHACGRPSAVLGTSPSMDGFASNSSSMEVNHVKKTLYNASPAAIVCDTEIMARAPMRNLWAGFGDMAAKYISVCEWRISALVTGSYYCESVAGMMRAALARIMAAAPRIPARDPDAIGAVAEGLVLAGLAMAFAEVSCPASGLEHYFSHVWEMLALDRSLPYDLHGIQVGVGTVLSLRMLRRLQNLQPDRARAESAMRAFDPENWAAEIRRVFGKTAPQIFDIEREAHKNDPAGHAVRLEKILAHWDDIRSIIDEELPDEEQLFAVMRNLGMPMLPADIGIDAQDTRDAFVHSRDIRDRYLTSSLLWDLGLMDEFAQQLKESL